VIRTERWRNPRKRASSPNALVTARGDLRRKAYRLSCSPLCVPIRALHSLAQADLLPADDPCRHAAEALIAQQVIEPRQEHEIRQSITALTHRG
jgi:hypothetical protein